MYGQLYDLGIGMHNAELQSLIQLSARIGQDLDLVQAGGGNTSLKENGTLWVKASGKWLADALIDDMFLAVPIADVRAKLAASDERFGEYATASGARLRPSVETTVHAVFPQRVVVHVHSVRAISWAVRQDGAAGLRERLDGLRWDYIPYVHPGVPLAEYIDRELNPKPDVLIIQNHGLVVAADDCCRCRQRFERCGGAAFGGTTRGPSARFVLFRSAMRRGPMDSGREPRSTRSGNKPALLLDRRQGIHVSRIIASTWGRLRLFCTTGRPLRARSNDTRRGTPIARVTCWSMVRAS